jgi:CBS domain-containing protein
MEVVMTKLMLDRQSAARHARATAFGWGVGIGTACAVLGTFLADPRLGRRRRALAADKLGHVTRASRHEVEKARRRLRNRFGGMLTVMRSRLEKEPVDDEILQERVRAALGRISRHPSAIQVEATEGRVSLWGPVLEEEHRRVVRHTRWVRGVTGVDDHLDVHRRADVSLLGASAGSGPPHPSTRTCAAAMKTDVQTVREWDSLRDAAELMAVTKVGFLPVCDEEGRAVGTITDRDIVVRAAAAGLTLDDTYVREIMTHDAIGCRPDDDITVAELLMGQYHVGRVVVTDERNVLKGVISLSDLAEREPARRLARTVRAVTARDGARAAAT